MTKFWVIEWYCFNIFPFCAIFEMITFGVNAQVETRGSIWNSWHQFNEMLPSPLMLQKNNQEFLSQNFY
jgi:hypothetical protein